MNTTVEILGFAREAGWLPWAVQYFFLVGVSIAAFFLTLPGLVWHKTEWRNLSRYALLAALISGLAAPVALLADLHQPGRFLNFYLHPNPGSWMAWGSFFIPLYLNGLLLYAWLNLRPSLAAQADKEEGKLAPLYRRLAYGGHRNVGAIHAAALVATVGALLVLLYTGIEVMVVRARPLWNTPLLPLVFLVSAWAGGIGLSGICEALAGRRQSTPLLRRWLERSQWAMLLLIVGWLVSALTGLSASAQEVLAATRHAPGWILTLGWLLGSTVLNLWLARSKRHAPLLPALLAVHGAWLVRWIVIMGGQEIPRIGSTSLPYAFSLTPDSLLGMIGIAGLCLALYIILTTFIPWDESAEA